MLRGAAVAVVVLGAVASALMANYENALQAAWSLWIASDSVSRQGFNAFARSLDLRDRYPGLQASAGARWSPTATSTTP